MDEAESDADEPLVTFPGIHSSGPVSIPSPPGPGLWRMCMRPRCPWACQTVPRVRSQSGREPMLRVVGPERLRTSARKGLDHKLRWYRHR